MSEGLQSLLDRYDAAFGNVEEICMPQLLTDPKFARLLEHHLEIGRPVTDADLKEAFPDEDWERVID